MPNLYIDADACPVRAEALRVATRHNIRVLIVSDGGLRPDPHPLVENVIVPPAPDAADDWIAERAGKHDIVVTSDIPLAARVVDSGARVVKPDGEVLTGANVGNALATRNLMTDLRSADPFRQGGAKPFTKRDRSRFLDVLERETNRAIRGAT